MRNNEVKRSTNETEIVCKVNLDGNGNNNINTGIGFFDHMLEIFSHHSLIDIELRVSGDTHVDFHHTVEDTGYALAKSILGALGEKKGISLHIIGFDINEPNWRAQLLAMAQGAGGHYWPAQEAGGLAKALRGSALGQPDGFHLMDEEGLPLQQGNFGERITLPEGPYRVQTQFANQTFEESLWINTETTTAVIFDASQHDHAGALLLA